MYLESIPAYNETQEVAALNIWDNLRKFIRYDYREEAIMQKFGSVVNALYEKTPTDQFISDLRSSLFVFFLYPLLYFCDIFYDCSVIYFVKL